MTDSQLEALRLELAEEQAAHAEAEGSRARLASILSEIDAIVWEADALRERFTFVSQQAESMLGYELSRWLEEDGFWHRIVDPEDSLLAELYFRESIGRGEDHEYEYRVRHADGHSLWLRDGVRVVQGVSGDVRLRGVTVDVTARRELEERLLQSQKMDAIGQLAAGVAHDFNNLLVVISGYTDLLLGRTADEESANQLREISHAARRATGLTTQLLAFGRRAPNLDEEIDLNDLVRGIEPMLRRLIDEDVALVLQAAAPLEPVRADTGQLEQVLVNLVINARDAMPHGGEIRIETTSVDLDVAGAAELGLIVGRYAVLEVSDNGTGMSNETKARIFEPFFTTKAQGKGTGLGLATVYGIVEQADGKVTIDTEVGRGTTFTIFYPTIGVSDEPGVDEPAVAPRVLVVEDEPAVRRLVRSVLEAEGYRVHEAANGREALEYLERRASHVDLILTDVVMPDINGPELVTRLGGLGHSARILFMSGYADSKLLSRGLNERTMRILRKPFTPDELKIRVGELIADIAAERDASQS